MQRAGLKQGRLMGSLGRAWAAWDTSCRLLIFQVFDKLASHAEKSGHLSTFQDKQIQSVWNATVSIPSNQHFFNENFAKTFVLIFLSVLRNYSSRFCFTFCRFISLGSVFEACNFSWYRLSALDFLIRKVTTAPSTVQWIFLNLSEV